MPRTLSPPALRTLFLLLEHGGFPVTPRLHIQLAHIYSLGPGGDTKQLQRILRALLVKRPEQRKPFDELFGQWDAEAQDWLEQVTHQPETINRANPGAPSVNHPSHLQTRPKRAPETRPTRRWLPATLALMLLTVILAWFIPDKETSNPKDPQPIENPEPPDEIQHQQTDLRQKRTAVYLPTIHIERVLPWPWLALILAALCSLPVLTLISRHLDTRRRPASMRITTDTEAPVAAGSPAVEAALLDRTQRKAMVWGMEKFRSELPAPTLDLAATVDATARETGILNPVFGQVRLERGLWLWLDDSTEDPTAALLARETDELLSRAGIPVDRAGFYANPQRLVTRQGKLLRPADLEEIRREITVLIFTDGRRLLALHDSPDRQRLNALLTRLSHWPCLAVVDFSNDSRLAGFTREHRLDCITPGALAAYLGRDGSAAADSSAGDMWGDDGIWAAACALAPDGLERDTALALARDLELRIGPWSLRTLLLEAGSGGGRLSWPLARRAEWLHWFGDLGDAHETGSPLSNALAFWDSHFSVRLDAYKGTARNSLGALRLLLWRSLIRLWRTPELATLELDALLSYGQENAPSLMKADIGRHLSQLCPADQQGEGLIHLPWRWHLRPARGSRNWAWAAPCPKMRWRRPAAASWPGD